MDSLRPFTLEPGDTLVMNTHSREFNLVKASGELVDLNALIPEPAPQSSTVAIGTFEDPRAFVYLCSILAASFGLVAARGACLGYTFTCPIDAPAQTGTSDHDEQAAAVTG